MILHREAAGQCYVFNSLIFNQAFLNVLHLPDCLKRDQYGPGKFKQTQKY